ncbi:MAG TPA: sulfite exporter TauE/SafE family protein [Cyclobacteriaceae bacterium]
MYTTAILMGFAGGLHCAGMCGPLVLAATAKNPFAGNKVIYNLGRILMYGILGVIAGAVGSVFPFADYQNLLGYLLGVILLLIGFGAINGLRIPILTPWVYQFTNWIKRAFGRLLKGNRNLFFLGMLNGLLPCGLTYLALTYCFTLDSFKDGFLFMIVFGAGTIPVMVGLLWLIGISFKNVNFSHRKVSTIVMIVIGSLVIGRTLISHSHHSDSMDQKEQAEGEVICK